MSDRENITNEKRINEDSDLYFDSCFQEKPLYIGPGEFECTADPGVMLVAKVGAGVVVCINDKSVGVGGLVHLVLPGDVMESFPHLKGTEDGYIQMEKLTGRFINALKSHGAGKNRIRVQIFGGTPILQEFADSGLMNVVFTKEYLMRKGLTINSVDIGGDECRRIHMSPVTGKVERIRLRRSDDISKLLEQEQAYLEKFRQPS